MPIAFRLVALAALMISVASPALAQAYVWALPAWLPPPPVPAANAMSVAKVELGRRLFFDQKLSGPSYISCSSCHMPEHAFSDPRHPSIGVTGGKVRRRAPPLTNVGYRETLTWADHRMTTLEDQAHQPLFRADPPEMEANGHEASVVDRFEHDPTYRRLFTEAFPDKGGKVDFDQIIKALAAYQRSLVSFTTPYERFRFAGEREALSPSAQRGEKLFFDARLGCGACHAGATFGPLAGRLLPGAAPVVYANAGLYDLDGKGAYRAIDRGLIESSDKPQDMGRFRAPSLRDVAQRAPYMHDGSMTSLEAVIDRYASGAPTLASSDRFSPLKDSRLNGFTISAAERDDLIAFLRALSDEAFAADERHGSPFR
ncbi:MAG: di-heme enzyme [Alphaproteobacteria bacterium]|nr:di-heme enzyme [Alphaproteobacteria bacterium]MCW5742979.1 di-heme enzyme [Alphaproteobacteria bacterium]